LYQVSRGLFLIGDNVVSQLEAKKIADFINENQAKSGKRRRK